MPNRRDNLGIFVMHDVGPEVQKLGTFVCGKYRLLRSRAAELKTRKMIFSWPTFSAICSQGPIRVYSARRGNRRAEIFQSHSWRDRLGAMILGNDKGS